MDKPLIFTNLIIFIFFYINLINAENKGAIDQEGSGGGYTEPPNTSHGLTTVEVFIIVVCAIVVTVLFLSYLIYVIVKDRKFSGRMTLIRLNSHTSETDESTLYMVDYDEVDINHGKLIMNVKEDQS